MADRLNVYRENSLIATAEYKNGKANVTIEGLADGTNYDAGYYTVTKSNEQGESKHVNVPAFQTRMISLNDILTDKESLNLEPGEDYPIQITFVPSTATDKSYTAKSSNENVVSVDEDGHLHGVAPGEADVTFTSNDGNKTATVHVTVVNTDED